MAPTLQQVNEDALTPLFDEEITLEEAYENASGPFKEFMSKHTRQKDLELFLTLYRSRTTRNNRGYSFNGDGSCICT